MSNINQVRDSCQPRGLQFAQAAQDLPQGQGSGGSRTSSHSNPTRVAEVVDSAGDSNDEMAEGYIGPQDRGPGFGSTDPITPQQSSAAKGKGRLPDDPHGLRGSFYKKNIKPVGDLSKFAEPESENMAPRHNEPWTDEERDLLQQLVAQSQTSQQIAQRLGRKLGSIRHARSRLKPNKEKPNKEKPSKEEIFNSIGDMRFQGVGIKGIAYQTGQTQKEIQRAELMAGAEPEPWSQERLEKLWDMRVNQDMHWNFVEGSFPGRSKIAMMSQLRKMATDKGFPCLADAYADAKQRNFGLQRAVDHVASTSSGLASLTVTSGPLPQIMTEKASDRSPDLAITETPPASDWLLSAQERIGRPPLPSVSPQKRSASSNSSKTRTETPVPKKPRQ